METSTTIRANHVSPEEVDEVLRNPEVSDVSRSSGRPFFAGATKAGRRLVVVVEPIDDVTVYPVTDYELED